MEGAVEFAAGVGAEDDEAVGVAFDFFAEGVGLGWEFVAGDGEGFAEGGEVGEDDCAGVVFGLVGDGEGAAEHGGEAALEFVWRRPGRWGCCRGRRSGWGEWRSWVVLVMGA